MKYLNILIFVTLLFAEVSAQPMYYTWDGSDLAPSPELNATWKETTINIKEIANYSLPSTVSLQQANTALSNSVIAWDFAGNLYTYTRDNEIASPGIAIGFSTNENLFLHSDTSPAVTKFCVSDNVYISSTTSITLNNTEGFAEDYNLTTFYPYKENDEIHLPSVILHELGHAFGLSHCSTLNSAMYEKIDVGEILTLNDDDTDGILALYDATVYGITGIEDYILFLPGKIIDNQLIETIFSTNTFYLPGGDAYILNFIDTDNSGSYMSSWDNWKCYASYGCGEVLIMDSQTIYIPTLPSGYNWERDANGNVIARMEKGGTDSDGIHHDASAEIKISGVPNNFITSGTLTSNTTWCGNLTITGNITIPVGKQLTIEDNSVISFANSSSLIVEGTLQCESSDYSAIELDFIAQNSTLKNGIKINIGAVANISNAEIRNAYTGIYVNGGSANIDNCLIRNGYSGIHLYGSNSVANITNTRIYEETVGIDMYYSNATLSYSEIDNNYIGISCYNASPLLATADYNGSSNGYNNIHTNTFGIMASYNSNPFLGRVTCEIFGGNNIIDLNTTKDINLNSYCTVYAENNWWGGGPGLYYKGTGCYIYDIPLLTSPPQMSQNKIKITPEEEEFNKKFVPQVTSSANSTEPLSLVTSTNEKSKYNDKWSIEWKLLYARNLIRLKKYNAAADICESVITEFPDSARSYLALDLLWQARKNDNKTLFNQFVDYKAKSKVKKQLFGAAEIMLALDQKESRISTLEKIEAKYTDTPLIEHVLFSKFMYYLYEENNIELAKTTADELGKLYPESESYYASQRHLGNDVVKPTEQLLAKEAVNEATTEIPQTYELLGNYPNPFNPSTTIKYALPYSSDVELTIYDITGKVITTLNRNGQSAGYQNIVWNGNSQQGSRVSSGVYFYRFKATSIDGSNKVFEKTAKMLMLK